MGTLLVSVDLTLDRLSATGVHRLFVTCQGKAIGWASDTYIKAAWLGADSSFDGIHLSDEIVCHGLKTKIYHFTHAFAMKITFLCIVVLRW